MLRVYIPKYRQIEDEDGKPYTVFVIDVFLSGRHHQVEWRYSEFHRLHKQLKKSLITPEFPPKRVRNWDQKVLEQRRKGLECYLQDVVSKGTLPRSLLAFLDVKQQDIIGNVESSDYIEAGTHQPLYCFEKDAFLYSDRSESPLDIISEGVYMALYEDFR